MTDSVPRPGHPVRGSQTGQPVMALFDLLGRAWAMGIVWQLNNGPYTFRQLQTACEDVSPSLLNRRLKELRATEIVAHGTDGYHLTPSGEELFRRLETLGSWADEWAERMAALES